MPMLLLGRTRAAVLALALVATAALTALMPPALAGTPPTQRTVSSSTERPVDPIAHDPTMVKEGESYYVAITGDLPSGTWAQYRIVNAGTGRSLVPQHCDGGAGASRLRTRPAQTASSHCLEWTLVPGAGGRWSLRNPASGASLRAELLIP